MDKTVEPKDINELIDMLAESCDTEPELSDAPIVYESILEAQSRAALELWRRWFRQSGDPIHVFKGISGLTSDAERHDFLECFFCGEPQPRNGETHKLDCVYVAAKRLVEDRDEQGERP